MNHGWRNNLIRPPRNWANMGPPITKERAMPDPLSHFADACAAISFVTEGAGIKPIEIRVADERDARALIAFLMASDSARTIMASPIDEKGHEFKICDIRVTWPQ
jgi:hypothetical protein